MDSRRAKNTDFTERQTNPCHKHMQNCKTRCLLQINLPHAKVILHSQDTLVYVAFQPLQIVVIIEYDHQWSGHFVFRSGSASQILETIPIEVNLNNRHNSIHGWFQQRVVHCVKLEGVQRDTRDTLAELVTGVYFKFLFPKSVLSAPYPFI